MAGAYLPARRRLPAATAFGCRWSPSTRAAVPQVDGLAEGRLCEVIGTLLMRPTPLAPVRGIPGGWALRRRLSITSWLCTARHLHTQLSRWITKLSQPPYLC